MPWGPDAPASATIASRSGLTRIPFDQWLDDAVALDRMAAALAGADIVVSSNGAVSPVVSLADVHHALADGNRDELTQPMVICDLGMPRDVDAAVTGLPGVRVIDMDRIQREPSAQVATSDTEAARGIGGGRCKLRPGRTEKGRAGKAGTSTWSSEH